MSWDEREGASLGPWEALEALREAPRAAPVLEGFTEAVMGEVARERDRLRVGAEAALPYAQHVASAGVWWAAAAALLLSAGAVLSLAPAPVAPSAGAPVGVVAHDAGAHDTGAGAHDTGAGDPLGFDPLGSVAVSVEGELPVSGGLGGEDVAPRRRAGARGAVMPASQGGGSGAGLNPTEFERVLQDGLRRLLTPGVRGREGKEVRF